MISKIGGFLCRQHNTIALIVGLIFLCMVLADNSSMKSTGYTQSHFIKPEESLSTSTALSANGKEQYLEGKK